MANSLYDFVTSEPSSSTSGGVNTAENQAPSTVNDAMRAWKQLEAAWLDDLGAVNTVAGTATAITVALAQGFTGYGTGDGQIPNGAVIAIKTGSAATGAATLNVNGIGNKAIRRNGDTAVVSGDWASGAVLNLRYDSAANSAAGAWIILNTDPLGMTAFARSLLVAANASAAQTTLGISDFIKTLLDDANASTARGTLGLENIDNTSDANKPVSTAQQTALNLKANLASPTFTGTVSGVSKAMVGLGDVDNTADSAKNVSYAASAGGVAYSNVSGRPNQGLNVADWPGFAGVTVYTDGLHINGGGLNASSQAATLGSLTISGTIQMDGAVRSQNAYDNTTVTASNLNVSDSGNSYRVRRSTSSIKYKKDVETLKPEYRDLILQLRPVWYRSKSDGDNPLWGHYGFIAEEVAETDPRLVHWREYAAPTPVLDEDGNPVLDDLGNAVTEALPLEPKEPEGVQYDRLVPALVSLVQELRDRVAALEAAE